MNIYDRIINMFLEARIEDYLERLDEARFEAGKKIKAGMPKKGGLTPPVKAYLRDMRAGAGDNPNVGAKKPGETGIDLMNRRQNAHIDSRGKKKPKP